MIQNSPAMEMDFQVYLHLWERLVIQYHAPFQELATLLNLFQELDHLLVMQDLLELLTILALELLPQQLQELALQSLAPFLELDLLLNHYQAQEHLLAMQVLREVSLIHALEQQQQL